MHKTPVLLHFDRMDMIGATLKHPVYPIYPVCFFV